MLKTALIFLVIGVIAAFFAFRRNYPTFSLIAKIVFYFSLAAFIVVLFTFMISSSPPISPGSGQLPI